MSRLFFNGCMSWKIIYIVEIKLAKLLCKQVLSTNIVMDLGESLNPTIDIGQIEGAFMQGIWRSYSLMAITNPCKKLNRVRLIAGWLQSLQFICKIYHYNLTNKFFFIGYGLFLMEQVLHSPDGHLLTRGPGAYKVIHAHILLISYVVLIGTFFYINNWRK